MAATDKDFEVPPLQEPTEWRGDGDYYYPVSRSHGKKIAPASPMRDGPDDRHALDELLSVVDRLKAELVGDARDAARWASCVVSLEAEIRRLHLAHAERFHPAATPGDVRPGHTNGPASPLGGRVIRDCGNPALFRALLTRTSPCRTGASARWSLARTSSRAKMPEG